MIGGRTIGWCAVTVWIVGLELDGDDEERRTIDGGLPDIEGIFTSMICADRASWIAERMNILGSFPCLYSIRLTQISLNGRRSQRAAHVDVP